MRERLSMHAWPLLLAALFVSACEDDKTPGGSGGTSTQDSGTTTSGGTAGSGGSAGTSGSGGTGGTSGTGGSKPNDGGTPPPGDGGLAPCLDLPTDLERPPSGRLPCDLLPPGFVAP